MRWHAVQRCPQRVIWFTAGMFLMVGIVALLLQSDPATTGRLWAAVVNRLANVNVQLNDTATADEAPLDQPATNETSGGAIDVRQVALVNGQQLALPALTESAGQDPQALLAGVVDWTRRRLARIKEIDDYSAILVKLERVDGRLLEQERLAIKVRQQPFSVYIRFLAPAKLRGQECIYVAGANEGKMLAHPAGFKQRLVGTVALLPTGPAAMARNRYPITEVGLCRLMERLIETAEREGQLEGTQVLQEPYEVVNGRPYRCLKIVHLQESALCSFHIARLFVDPQWNLPVKFESYCWPKAPGGEPELIEQYSYENLKFNNGFTDQDFMADNPAYEFTRKTR